MFNATPNLKDFRIFQPLQCTLLWGSRIFWGHTTVENVCGCKAKASEEQLELLHENSPVKQQEQVVSSSAHQLKEQLVWSTAREQATDIVHVFSAVNKNK